MLRGIQSLKSFVLVVTIAALSALTGSLSTKSLAQTLQQPATGYGQFLIGGAPDLAYFNGKLYAAFGANDGSAYMYITTSTDGQNFTSSTQYPNMTVGASPALVAVGNTLYLLYRDAFTGAIMSAYSTDGVNFTLPLQLDSGGGGLYSSSTVSATTNGSGIYFAYEDASGYVYVGNWAGAGGNGASVTQASLLNTTPNAPSITYFNSNFVVAFQTGSHQLAVNSSSDAVNWSTETTYPGIQMGSAPSIAVFEGYEMMVTFQSNDKYHWLFQTTGTNQSNFSSPAIGYGGLLIGSAPAMVSTYGLGFPYSLYCAFKSNDRYNWLFLTHTTQ